MENQKKVMDVNIKSFISSLAIMVVLMVISYVMTLVIPTGMYEREMIDGSEMIVALYGPMAELNCGDGCCPRSCFWEAIWGLR